MSDSVVPAPRPEIPAAPTRLSELAAAYIAGSHRDWTRAIAHPLTEALARYFPAHTVTGGGPMGVGCHFQIGVRRRADDAFVGALLLAPGDLAVGELRQVDTRADTGRYRPGSMGHVHGLHHPEVALPDLIADIAELLRLQLDGPDDAPDDTPDA